MSGVSDQTQECHYPEEDDDESWDEEGPAPSIIVAITVSPEGRDDGAQDVTHRGVGVPHTHYQTSTRQTM